MSRTTYFVQECPTCGRNLQVRVQYLGKQIVCQHCGARFEAYDPGSAAYPPPPSSISLLERAEQLLQTASASRVGVPVGSSGLMSDVLPVRPK
jgi:DNA-directed RNA polymerase subunit RPC12/RpoP